MNRLILSCAGSGKTSYIVESVLALPKNEKALITTFTDSNCLEIRKKFVLRNKCIPSGVDIIPWFSFLIRDIIKPYQTDLIKGRIEGTIMVNGFSNTWMGEDSEEYYLKDNKIYTDKIAALGIKMLRSNANLIISRLTNIYKHIYINEFQDLAGYDLEIVNLLLKSKSEILMVGDPRQKTYSTHNTKKHRIFRDRNYNFFQNSEYLKIDKDSLKDSYRCPEETIVYASRIFPNLPSSHSKSNKERANCLLIVRPNDVLIFSKKYRNTICLTYNIKTKIPYGLKRMNLGLSKGLTFENVLLYPTSDMKAAIVSNDFSLIESNSSKCKLYVGLTRAKGITGIVIDNKFETNRSGIPVFDSNMF